MRMRNVRNDPAACMRSRWYLLPTSIALLLGGGCCPTFGNYRWLGGKHLAV